MANAATSVHPDRQNALLPRAPGGLGAGVAASLGAHALLLAALAGVVQWRTQSPMVAAAELWSSVPEAAAAPPLPAPVPAPAPAPVAAPAPPPAPPPPAPAVKPPDIVTEQAARQRAERERQEREQRERREREQKDRAAAEQRRLQQEAALDRARQDQLRRIQEAAGSTGTTPSGTAPRDAAPSASYVARLAALIRSNSVFSGEVSGNTATEVEVRTTAGGAILSRRLVKSSGNPAWDDAVLRAIDRTEKLPPDTNGRVPPTLLIAFRPKE